MRLPAPHPAGLPAAPADEQRTLESYIGSVSVASLAGGAYQLAAEADLPPERRRREGQVMHVYLPDSSLAQHGGLWVSDAFCRYRCSAQRASLRADPGCFLRGFACFLGTAPS